MRTVASYALTSAIVDDQDPETYLTGISSTVNNWVESKGVASKSSSGSGSLISLPDGREAEYVEWEVRSTAGAIKQHRLLEPTDTGLFQTSVAVGYHERRVAVFVELRAGAPAYQVGPVNVDVRCPAIVRDLMESDLDWYVGDTLVSTRVIAFNGESSGRRLAQVIAHSSRNLPVVVVSEHEGATLSENFPENLARDLSGLAIVAHVDPSAAWALTQEMGREWSCFNGAIRLFWPFSESKENPYRHPLWTRQTLLRRVTDVKDASYAMRKTLRKRILGLSAYSVREPEFYRWIRSAARREEADRLKNQMQAGGDWKEIAEAYANDNDELRDDIERKDEEIGDLKLQLANLQSSLSWQPESGEEPVPEPEIPPATVVEAVTRASKEFSESIIIGSDVEEGVGGVASDAGPPEKIYQYFQQLAELAEAVAQGPLGTTVVDWLKRRGVNVSTESETIQKSDREMNRRTWDDGRERSPFILHMKPSDATAPDRCVRIYFDVDNEMAKVRVGWVGRHPE